MPIIKPQHATRHTQRFPRRRGSILIMVVALLTLIALIGTALIATARTDRYTTRAYVDAATQDAIRQQYINQAVSLVEDSLKNDKTPTIDSPRFDTWLADRLPARLDPSKAVGPGNPPVWRHITGWLVTDLNDPTVANPATSTVVRDFQPPYQANSAAPVSVATADKTTSYVKIRPGLSTDTTLSSKFFSASPTSLSITYPATHPEESIRNQTRTYPAFTFYNDSNVQVGLASGYLAGDADGDGIADSALFRLSPTPVDGVTYYAAVRIIDNNSAVNVNTAWSRDHDFDATGAQVNPTGFFPTSVGLYELLRTSKDPSDPASGASPDNEIAELNEYRFGYPKDQKTTNNWTDPFKDFTGTTQTTLASLKPIEDRDNSPAPFGNANTPTLRTDFTFNTQGEALSMQLGRRVDNPGYNSDPANVPASPNAFPYRGYSLADASTAALTYHFLMANPDASASDLELRLRKSLYESAPNYTDYPHGSGKLPGYGFSGDTKVHHWSSFPANEYLLWFQYLDYTPLTTSSTLSSDPSITDFIPTSGVVNPPLSGPKQFRSIRPLLTTYSATSNLISSYDYRTNPNYSWNHNTSDNLNKALLYPGMILNDMTNNAAAVWSGTTYHYGDMVFDKDTHLTYMRTNDTTANPDPATDTTYTHWEPQNRVTGKARINPNLAGFPELWYGFFSLMTAPTKPTIDGGTPFDKEYLQEAERVTGTAYTDVNQAFNADPSYAALYDIYRGMHWTEDYGNVFNPASTTSDIRNDPHFNALTDAFDASGYQTSALHMFRSPIRDPRPMTAQTGGGANAGLYRLTPLQTTALRSAIAAVNTKQLLSRNTTGGNPNGDPVVRTITLYDVDPGAASGAGMPDPPTSTPSANAPAPQYEVTIYGNCVQPFITEVYATNDNFEYHRYTDPTDPTVVEKYQNADGYVAIELHNPYSVDIDLTGFRILNLPRNATGYTGTGMSVTGAAVVHTFASGTIPAGGYVVLENVADSGIGGGNFRPPSANFAGTPPIQIDALKVFLTANAGEFVLLRPRILGTQDLNVEDGVPADSYDFTGFPAVNASATGPMTVWHYARATDDWQFVFPGRYDASPNSALHAAGDPRQQGTERTPTGTFGQPDAHTYTPVNPAADNSTPGTFDPWMPANTALPQQWLDMVSAGGGWNGRIIPDRPATLGALNPLSTYANDGTGSGNTVSIQLNNTDMPGRHPVLATGSNLYPFGGFARNGDLLQVPFIAAYRIRRLQPDTGSLVSGGSHDPIDPGKLVDAATDVIELNPVTMDAAFAEDTLPTNNAHQHGALLQQQENVGRFTPPFVAGPPPVDDNSYRWTASLFNYFSVNTPSLDFLPNTDPHTYTPGLPPKSPRMLPQPVANHTPGQPNILDSASPVTEDSVPLQGLINLNTAPFRVLASLPLVPNSAGGIDVPNTEAVAKAIIKYRDLGATPGAPLGDFRSLFDLNKVTDFAIGTTSANVLNTDPSDLAGDYSGKLVNGTGAGNVDGVRFDFEEQYLLMNRISNLVTTHSDTYTVYILVQGWRDAGTPYPVLDWEKRVAYIMDRSSGTIKKVAVPTD